MNKLKRKKDWIFSWTGIGETKFEKNEKREGKGKGKGKGKEKGKG